MSRAGIQDMSRRSSSGHLHISNERRQSNALGILDQSIGRVINQKQSAYHNEFELQKENDFLHLRNQQLSKQVLDLLHLKKSESLYQEKLEFYEAVIEDITSENTTLVMRIDKLQTENTKLESNKASVLLDVEAFRQSSKRYAEQVKDLEHKLQV